VEIQRQGEHRIGFHVPGRGHFVSKSWALFPDYS
jgi:hypothetical protein